MINADDILTPHPPEVVAARKVKKMARFEEFFPGLLQKTKEWMETEEFRERYENTTFCTTGPFMFAPVSMEHKMKEMSGKGRSSMSQFTKEQTHMICDEAIILWNEGKRALRG